MAATGAPPGFSSPIGLDLDTFGNVFVADSQNNAITEYSAGSSGAATPIASIGGADTGLDGPQSLSELPPPPVPRLHAFTPGRRSRTRLLRQGILLRLSAFGRLAFRSQPVTVSAIALVRGARLGTARAVPLRPGKTTLRLVESKRAARLLRRHHKTVIKVIITMRGGFGTLRHRLTITCTG